MKMHAAHVGGNDRTSRLGSVHNSLSIMGNRLVATVHMEELRCCNAKKAFEFSFIFPFRWRELCAFVCLHIEFPKK